MCELLQYNTKCSILCTEETVKCKVNINYLLCDSDILDKEIIVEVPEVKANYIYIYITSFFLKFCK